eukprot:Rmarinus@m.9702
MMGRMKTPLTGYCSWCFKKTSHKKLEKDLLHRALYQCEECLRKSVPCKKPNCTSMARSTLRRDEERCWVHRKLIKDWTDKKSIARFVKQGWCSWCGSKSTHKLVDVPIFPVRSRVFECMACSKATQACRTCDAFSHENEDSCAVCRGTISDWAEISHSLRDDNVSKAAVQFSFLDSYAKHFRIPLSTLEADFKHAADEENVDLFEFLCIHAVRDDPGFTFVFRDPVFVFRLLAAAGGSRDRVCREDWVRLAPLLPPLADAQTADAVYDAITDNADVGGISAVPVDARLSLPLLESYVAGLAAVFHTCQKLNETARERRQLPLDADAEENVLHSQRAVFFDDFDGGSDSGGAGTRRGMKAKPMGRLFLTSHSLMFKGKLGGKDVRRIDLTKPVEVVRPSDAHHTLVIRELSRTGPSKRPAGIPAPAPPVGSDDDSSVSAMSEGKAAGDGYHYTAENDQWTSGPNHRYVHSASELDDDAKYVQNLHKQALLDWKNTHRQANDFSGEGEAVLRQYTLRFAEMRHSLRSDGWFHLVLEISVLHAVCGALADGRRLSGRLAPFDALTRAARAVRRADADALDFNQIRWCILSMGLESVARFLAVLALTGTPYPALLLSEAFLSIHAAIERDREREDAPASPRDNHSNSDSDGLLDEEMATEGKSPAGDGRDNPPGTVDCRLLRDWYARVFFQHVVIRSEATSSYLVDKASGLSEVAHEVWKLRLQHRRSSRGADEADDVLNDLPYQIGFLEDMASSMICRVMTRLDRITSWESPVLSLTSVLLFLAVAYLDLIQNFFTIAVILNVLALLWMRQRRGDSAWDDVSWSWHDTLFASGRRRASTTDPTSEKRRLARSARRVSRGLRYINTTLLKMRALYLWESQRSSKRLLLFLSAMAVITMLVPMRLLFVVVVLYIFFIRRLLPEEWWFQRALQSWVLDYK